jgi:hypothetical protein
MPAVFRHGLEPHVACVLVVGEVPHIYKTCTLVDTVWGPVDAAIIFYHQVSWTFFYIRLSPVKHHINFRDAVSVNCLYICLIRLQYNVQSIDEAVVALINYKTNYKIS